jgi:hypothetical protein
LTGYKSEAKAGVAAGGEIGAGILYDSTANLLTLNVGWGSAFGFTDLSSAANNSLRWPITSLRMSDLKARAAILTRLARLIQ